MYSKTIQHPNKFVGTKHFTVHNIRVHASGRQLRAIIIDAHLCWRLGTPTGDTLRSSLRVGDLSNRDAEDDKRRRRPLMFDRRSVKSIIPDSRMWSFSRQRAVYYLVWAALNWISDTNSIVVSATALHCACAFNDVSSDAALSISTKIAHAARKLDRCSIKSFPTNIN
jgi:hypothetical protein